MKSSYLDNYLYSNPNFNFTKSSVSKIRSAASKDRVTPSGNQLLITKFKEIRRSEKCILEANEDSKVLRLRWCGRVGIHTTKKIIAAAINTIKLHGYTKLILDQSDLAEFETESRVWIKEFLKTSSHKFSASLSHLASIRPKTISGNIFSNFASEILKEALPNLKLRRFETVEEATKWLDD